MHNQHEQRNNYNRRTDKTEFFADNRKDKIGMIFGYINNVIPPEPMAISEFVSWNPLSD